MIGSIDLVLATLERALGTSVLPALTDADAKQEASLGALFARWLRDVVDHGTDAERASLRDAAAAIAEVAAAARGELGESSRTAIHEIAAWAEEPAAEEITAVRDRTCRAKALLGRALHGARADGDRELALEVRRILTRFAAREIERDLAFARATGMDPDVASVTPIAELLRRGTR